jgi:hypothetical protein
VWCFRERAAWVGACVWVSTVVLLSHGGALAQGAPGAGDPDVIRTPPQPGEIPAPHRPIGALPKEEPLQLLFRSPDKGVSFHLRLGATYRDVTAGAARFGLRYHSTGYPAYTGQVASGYAPICETPCAATLYPGFHRMALALNEGYPLDVQQAVRLTRDSIVEGRYVDRSGMRKAGSMIMFLGTIGGMAMMLGAAHYGNFSLTNYPVFYTGLGLITIGLAVGVPLMTRSDEASVNVYPLGP